MKIADMHGDSIFMMWYNRKNGIASELAKNDLHMDIEKMQKADYLAQNFALFVNQGSGEDPYEEAMAEYKIFVEEMEKNKDKISQVFKYEDILENERKGKLSAILTLEEGEICKGDIKKLEEFYGYGARMMALTWNYDNSLSTANVNKATWKRNYSGNRAGLTETGIEFIERMEELGMIPDVSHMSDEGIEDLLQVAKKPFVASHSNARSLCNHPRNLTDDFLKRMGEKGCVIGTNFASIFLKENADYSKNEWIVDHICYMVDKAGIESVGFGTDFDGIECGLEIENCSNMPVLAELLKQRGMSEEQVERIFYKNIMRLYKELL